MLFYTFSHSSGDDIGKVFPQSQTPELPDGKTVKDDDYIWNVQFCEIPDFIPFIGKIRLENRAKITDLISTSYIGSGYVMSDKLFNLLKEFSLGEYIHLPVNVTKGHLVYNYHWIHFANNESQNIDFDATGFEIRDSFGDTEPVSIYSNEELNNIRESVSSLKKIVPKKLTLLKRPVTDCFYLKGIYSSIIISTEIKKNLIEQGLTGIALKEIEIVL